LKLKQQFSFSEVSGESVALALALFSFEKVEAEERSEALR